MNLPVSPPEFVNTKVYAGNKWLSQIERQTDAAGSIPLFFLHANGMCAGVYKPFLKLFPSKYQITAGDVAGQGDSDHHGRERIVHWDIFAWDLCEIIEKHMHYPIVGMGHSLGAVVTCLAASFRPDLFSKIVLIDPVVFSPFRLFMARLLHSTELIGQTPFPKGARRRKKYFTSRADAYDRFASGHGMFSTWQTDFILAYTQHALKETGPNRVELKCDPETEAQIFESILTDIWHYPATVNCPVLLIRGEKSYVFTKGAAKKMNQQLPASTLVTIENCGHFVPMEQPDSCAEIISAWL